MGKNFESICNFNKKSEGVFSKGPLEMGDDWKQKYEDLVAEYQDFQQESKAYEAELEATLAQREKEVRHSSTACEKPFDLVCSCLSFIPSDSISDERI